MSCNRRPGLHLHAHGIRTQVRHGCTLSQPMLTDEDDDVCRGLSTTFRRGSSSMSSGMSKLDTGRWSPFRVDALRAPGGAEAGLGLFFGGGGFQVGCSTVFDRLLAVNAQSRFRMFPLALGNQLCSRNHSTSSSKLFLRKRILSNTRQSWSCKSGRLDQ